MGMDGYELMTHMILEVLLELFPILLLHLQMTMNLLRDVRFCLK